MSSLVLLTEGLQPFGGPSIKTRVWFLGELILPLAPPPSGQMDLPVRAADWLSWMWRQTLTQLHIHSGINWNKKKHGYLETRQEVLKSHCPSVCLTCPPLYMSICLSLTCPPLYMSVCLSVSHLSTSIHVCLSVCLSPVHLHTCLSFCLSVSSSLVSSNPVVMPTF